MQENSSESNTSEYKLDEKVKDHVETRLENIKKFSTGLYVDSNTVDAAILNVKNLEAIEELLDQATGKSIDYKKYKLKNDLIKPYIEKAAEIRKVLRVKLWAFVKNGGIHKFLSLRAAPYEISIENEEDVPREYLTVDLKKIQEIADNTEGNIVIPGILISKKDTLIISVNKGKK